MGFLDFLKKTQTAPRADTTTDMQTPLPPLDEDKLLQEMIETKSKDKDIDLPLPPTGKPDFLEAAAVDTTPEKEPIENPFGATSAKTSVPTATMLAGPLKRDPIPPALIEDADPEKIPLPPVSMQDPDFLTSAANDIAPPAKPKEPVEQKKPELPFEKPETATIEVPIAAIDLPDFTDEEIAAVEQPKESVKEPVREQSAWAMPEPTKPTIPETKPIIDKKDIANAIERQKEDMLPPKETVIVEEPQPAKFLSSNSYFDIVAEIRATRKTLRQNDDLLKDATLRHEQLDAQHKRVAQDANAVQEQLMRVERALFEE